MATIYKRKTISDHGVSVITSTNRINHLDSVFKNFMRQTHKRKELIIILNNNKMNIDEYRQRAANYGNIKIFKLDENKNTSECKNFAFNYANYEFIAFFDDDDYYGPNYLAQAMEAFTKSKADIVGKGAFYIFFENLKILALVCEYKINRYVSKVCDSSMVIKRSVLESIKFPITQNSGMDTKFQEICINENYKIYCTDYFNFVIHRHNQSGNEHTWKINDDDLLKQCRIIKTNFVDYHQIVNK